jgi:hypothetical protein
MEIDRAFIQAEIDQVQAELAKARTFVIQAETSLAIYAMLLDRLNKTCDESCEGEIKPGGTD